MSATISIAAAGPTPTVWVPVASYDDTTDALNEADRIYRAARCTLGVCVHSAGDDWPTLAQVPYQEMSRNLYPTTAGA